MAMTPTRGRSSTGTVTMASSDDDAMEESSVFTLSSPPGSASKSLAATALFQDASTPKSSRRLFNDDDDGDEDFVIRNIHDNSESRKTTAAPALTPYNAKLRRRLPRPIQREDSIESVEDLTGRKRSSEERRDSSDGDTSMHMSPHISPNSYMTMDGRFVHSRNPFSSPMVTEDDNHHQHHHHHMQAMATAPSLPVSFASSSHPHAMGQPSHGLPPPVSATQASPHRPPALGLLPPRNTREKRGTYRRIGEGNASGGTFFDARFSFTGSPIPEHSHPVPHPMPDPGSATAGSLQKVRRLTENDDIVSASGHHLYSRRRQYLTIDTTASDISCTSFSDSSTGTWKADEEDRDHISPTDILSFPAPPTPTKNAPSSTSTSPTFAMSHYPRYKTRQAPPTPVAQRRHEKLVQRRTPHPGSILRRHRPDEENDQTTPAIKSRFYDDFDIIQELGKGSFGTVFQVLSRLDGVSIASELRVPL